MSAMNGNIAFTCGTRSRCRTLFLGVAVAIDRMSTSRPTATGDVLLFCTRVSSMCGLPSDLPFDKGSLLHRLWHTQCPQSAGLGEATRPLELPVSTSSVGHRASLQDVP